MKNRFTTLDILSEITELKNLVGMRLNQVYDVDQKTYLLKLHRPEEKVVLLLESGSRFHLTRFERSKNPAPSGFSMKLRKHLNNKRLESIKQLNNDRIVEFTFGSGEALYRLILELYDKGNMILTDGDYVILNILRPRLLDKGNPSSNKMVVREIYPAAPTNTNLSPQQTLQDALQKVKPNDQLKRVVMGSFPYGPALLEHFLLTNNIPPNTKVKDLTPQISETLLNIIHPDYTTNFLIEKVTRVPIILQKQDGDLKTYLEFHPFAMQQHLKPQTAALLLEFSSFDECIDEFFSKIEGQKIDLKTLQKEKLALKKLENVKKDHSERITKLQMEQGLDRRKGELIELNTDLVEKALKVIRSSLANQIAWKEIQEIVEDASSNGDPVAKRISKLKLETNHFSLRLSDPYSHTYDSDDEETEELRKEHEVDINIELSAQANARNYFAQRKAAAIKEGKTLESHSLALKSAQRKTKQTLKEVAAISTIIKARKTFWFEKFYWFISSENYLIIAGRDMQQNELIIKRYMKANDLYVHAELHGATSVVIKNPGGNPVPPKTLNEAGTMAVCYSAAWDSKMVTNAWWVNSSQVSKSAPTGEYLTTGSFIIRGKKNFLPPCHLVLGFGILFKLEESSVPRHKDERKVRTLIDGEEPAPNEQAEENEEIDISDEEEESVSLLDMKKSLPDIEEEEQKPKHSETTNKDDVSSEAESNAKDDDGDEKIPNETSDDEKEISFPDTNIEIGYSLKGEMKVQIQGSGVSESKGFTFKDKISVAPQKANTMEGSTTEESQKGANIRGKKGKMKKQKEKYKDQDSHEKEIRMRLLQERTKEGVSKRTERKNAQQKKEAAKAAARQRAKERQERKNMAVKSVEGHGVDELGGDFEEKVIVSDEVDMLDTLTGIPMEEDELLFCVPVVGPYQVMSNYKFKVKVTPGTSKKGKATKTALSIFSNDKLSSNREKDLFKSIKDQDLARNMPGKVKLSGSQAIKKLGKK